MIFLTAFNKHLIERSLFIVEFLVFFVGYISKNPQRIQYPVGTYDP